MLIIVGGVVYRRDNPRIVPTENVQTKTIHGFGNIYNELGKVFVVEYHRISTYEGDWVRSPKAFRADLERFYDLGFRLVSVDDFFNKNRVAIPKGKKPMIITFDDGHISQFRYLFKGKEKVIDPDCAVGILDEFSKKHGDFGKSATFFVNSNPFYQSDAKDLWKEKLQYLVKTGREIGNHTYEHEKLSDLSFIEIKKTLALEQAKIEEALPSYEASSVALPFGILPKRGRWLLQDGEYNGIPYHYKVAFLVGAGPAMPSYHKDFNPSMVERIQASDEELDKWIGKLKRDPDRYYTSDGDPNIISVQEKDLINLEKTELSAGMIVKVCTGETVVREIKIRSRKEITDQKKTADKGVYFTYHSAGIPDRINSLISYYKKHDFKTIVIDMKDVEGILGVSMEVTLANKIGAQNNSYVRDLKGLVSKLHKENINVSARIAVFKDQTLARRRPDLAIKNINGSTYIQNGEISWVDPFSQEVWDYNLDIANEAVKAGVDEIQFDYIRFPEQGRVENIDIPANKEKYDAIEGFLKKANERFENSNVSIAIDVFGVMSWLKDKDIETIGQRVGYMAKYVNVISPMLYPSHFDNGFDGFSNPSNEPYTFMRNGTEKTIKIVKGTDAKIVPWIQGFSYRVKNFDEKYINEQIRGLKDCGISNYLVWNAGNNYTVTYSALNK